MNKASPMPIQNQLCSIVCMASSVFLNCHISAALLFEWRSTKLIPNKNRLIIKGLKLRASWNLPRQIVIGQVQMSEKCQIRDAHQKVGSWTNQEFLTVSCHQSSTGFFQSKDFVISSSISSR
ncbi:hypothetical protein PRUPE_1G575400 [Prunus persica]|uniref:Uncharacterized protein n=1 Tax=Prunus persica TaxID=3760 RepID=A0A251RJP2_PRUPE|nr:hypothetical protein PRUPE_1G575400 [Prunus persica]